MKQPDQILTVSEVAHYLRCSKAHVYHAINGVLPGISPLPVIPMGRLKLVRRSALEEWAQANEKASSAAMIRSSPEVDSANA